MNHEPICDICKMSLPKAVLDQAMPYYRVSNKANATYWHECSECMNSAVISICIAQGRYEIVEVRP